MRLTAFAALAATILLAPPGRAADAPKTLEQLFAPLSGGGCVKIDNVRAIAATVDLTPDQFQFVRAFWMAIPPLSHDLPPGDTAFIAREPNGDDAIGLYVKADGDVCAIFKAADWLERLIDRIGRGEVGERGEKL